MKKLILIAALFVAMMPSAAFAQQRDNVNPDEQTAGPNDAMTLAECKTELTTSQGNAKKFLEKFKGCQDAYCTPERIAAHDPVCEGMGAPSAPSSGSKPAVHHVVHHSSYRAAIRCEGVPVSEPQHVGNDCACGNPGYVAVVRSTFHAKVCVPRREAETVDLTALQRQVDALNGKYADLQTQLDELRKLHGDQFQKLYNELEGLIPQVADHERRIEALENAIQQALHDAAEAKHIALDAKHEADEVQKMIPRTSLHLGICGLLGASSGTGLYGGPGICGELEHFWDNKSTVSGFMGMGGGLSFNRAQATTAFGMFNGGVRFYTDEERKLGIGVGGLFTGHVSTVQSAGDMGIPSTGRRWHAGPMLDLQYNFSPHARFGVALSPGYGKWNYFEGNAFREDSGFSFVGLANLSLSFGLGAEDTAKKSSDHTAAPVQVQRSYSYESTYQGPPGQ